MSHTPGPWEAGRPDMATIVDGYESKWIYAGETYVAVASGMMLGWDEVMANAHLIAAAPDLLEALERIAVVPDCGCVPCRGQCDSVENLKINAEEIREIAREAIRKAKGQPQ